MRTGCSAVPQGAGIIPIRKLRKIGAFQSVPYHTVPAQELNTKASEKQLAGCIVFQRFFPARRPTGSPAGRKHSGISLPDNRGFISYSSLHRWDSDMRDPPHISSCGCAVPYRKVWQAYCRLCPEADMHRLLAIFALSIR